MPPTICARTCHSILISEEPALFDSLRFGHCLDPVNTNDIFSLFRVLCVLCALRDVEIFNFRELLFSSAHSDDKVIQWLGRGAHGAHTYVTGARDIYPHTVTG